MVRGVRGRWRGMAYVAAAALLLSSAGLFIKVLNLGAFQINFYRSLVAALTIALVLRLRRQPIALRLDPLSLGCYLTYAGMPILFVASTKLTTAANAIFLQYTAPIFLLFMEPWLDRRPVSRRELGAVAACVGGMGLFFVGHLGASGALGNVLGICSGLNLALFSLLMKRNRRRQGGSPFAVMVFGNLLVGLLCLPMAMGSLRLNLGQGLALAYLGVFQLGLSWILFTAGMKYLSATAAIIICMLEAVFNPVWVYLGVGERPSGYALVGGALLLGTVVWFNLKAPPSVAEDGP